MAVDVSSMLQFFPSGMNFGPGPPRKSVCSDGRHAKMSGGKAFSRLPLRSRLVTVVKRFVDQTLRAASQP